MASALPKSLVDDPFISEREAAAVLGLSPATLSSWRSLGRYDLCFYRSGRLIRYRLSHVLEFLERRRCDPQPAA
jgi:predicted DNA-binding transcriptional regulator AlpA